MIKNLLVLFLITICGLSKGQLLRQNAFEFPQLRIIADKLNSITNYQADCDLIITSSSQGTMHSASTLITHKVFTDTLCGYYYYFKTHEQYKNTGEDFTAFFNNAFYLSKNNSINKYSLLDEPKRFKEIKYDNGYVPAIHRSSFYLRVLPKELSEFIHKSLANGGIILQRPDTLINGKYCMRYIFNANSLASSPYKELCFEKEFYSLYYYKSSSGSWNPQYIIAAISNTKINQQLADNYFSEENLFGRKLGKNVKEIKTSKFSIGDVIPDWELPILGKTTKCSSKALRGKYILLEFTGTWCSHCIESVEMMNKLETEFKENKKLSIYSVFSTERDDIGKINNFANAQNVKSTILHSAKGLGEQCGISVYPTIFIIDPVGKIGLIVVGYGQDTENKINNYLKENLKR